ncbi:MAG: DUF952 domain-containing protein [Alphaproteobacteria bacterium]|nr:DUF952 domain-containing protein [Alphaproteobacteria bacterium]
MPGDPIFHACRESEWVAALARDAYAGSSQDVADGFIHFSDVRQVAASLAKHRSGQDGLVLVAVDPDSLGATLRWEPSRGGALFPHLYGSLRPSSVLGVARIPIGPTGRHVLPSLAEPASWPTYSA